MQDYNTEMRGQTAQLVGSLTLDNQSLNIQLGLISAQLADAQSKLADAQKELEDYKTAHPPEVVETDTEEQAAPSSEPSQ